MKRYLIVFVLLFLMIHSSNFSQQASDNANLSITGKVTDKATGNPLPGITVRVLGTQSGAITRSDGKFTVKGLQPGIYSVQFSSVGHETYVESNVVLNSGSPVMLEITMIDKIIELKGAEVRASYFQKRIESATSTQNFSAEEIRRAPGVQEDVIRATALLPGVAVTQAGRNDLAVRGGAPFENLFIVDNIEVPNINHFGSQGASGGPLALINIDLVRNVDFSAGGFGANYGDKLSSLTNITLRNGNDQRLSGEANLSATGFGLIFEGPLSEDGSFLFSARRSYLDLIFKAAGFGFIPQYWDFQGKFNYTLDKSNSLSFLTIGALNDVTLNNDDLDKKYENSRFAVPEQQQYFSGLTWKHLFGNGFANITLGRTFTNFKTIQNDSLLNPIFKNYSTEGEVSLKTDFDFLLTPGLQLNFGNQLKYASKLEYNVIIPAFMRKDENGTGRSLNVDTNFTALRNGTYASMTIGLGQNKLTLGGRMDYYNFLEPKLFFSPRLSLVYQINPVSALVLATGRYYQAPSFIWLVGGSEQAMKPILADQLVLGYQHTPLEDVKVQLEGYYKWYGNYPARVFRPQAVLSPSGFDDITTDIPFGLEPLMSSGEGISRGLELFIQKKLSDIPLYGLVSLTLSETKFKSIDGIERTGSFDTRFIFNISAGYRFASEWEVSGKFRIATGLPTTPFKADKSGELDFNSYNAGERLPTFHQLDLRIDKRWNFSWFALNTYLDIQNVYARKNASGIKWNYRTKEAEYNESIGVLPSIGIAFEF